MSNFDERSGIVACETEWGRWWQTVDDVTVEIHVLSGTKAKDIKCTIKPTWISVTVSGNLVFEVIPRVLKNTWYSLVTFRGYLTSPHNVCSQITS